jgi:glycosyltransferase involved in cell wall biosynthesis
MRVLLIGNYPPDCQESMQRFAVLLKSELRTLGVEARLLRPEARLIRLAGPGANAHRGMAKLLGYLDKYVVFPLMLLRAVRGYDAVHICDHSNAMYGRWAGGKPWILTCNDLLAVRSALGEFPQNPTRWSGRVLQSWILSWLGRAPHLACISEATRKDVLRLTEQPSSRASVVHMGLNHSYKTRSEDDWQPVLTELLGASWNHASSRFVFHVGGNQWYKNREGVIRLFSRLAEHDTELSLLVAGQAPTQEQEQLVQRLGLGSRVHFLGNVSNRELEALYHGAEFLLFPSLAEGFGWPVIEAQACGCRVVTSNIEPLPEVGGEGVVYLDLENETESVARMLGLLKESENERRRRIDAGYENVRRFNPAQMAEKYCNLYQQVMTHARCGSR